MASEASDYRPRPGAQVCVPPAVRDFGEVFIALSDGLWWEDQRLTSMDCEAAQLGNAWGNPDVADLVSAFD